MCKQLSRIEKQTEVIAVIKCSKNFYERIWAMGVLSISLVWAYLKSKEATKYVILKEKELILNSFDQIENKHDMKVYIKITM